MVCSVARWLPTRYVYSALKILFVCIDSCAVKAYDVLCLVCATSRIAPFAIWFSTHWLAPLYQVAVRLIRAPCDDALVPSAVLRCELYWGSELRASGDRQADRQAGRQAGRPSGRVSGQVVVVSGRLFTTNAGRTTWDLWWTEFDFNCSPVIIIPLFSRNLLLQYNLYSCLLREISQEFDL